MKLTKLAQALAIAPALAFGAMTLPVAMAQPESSLVTQEVHSYFIYFNEPGALKYTGGTAGLARTANERPGERFDASRAEVSAYRAHLSSLRQQRVADFERVLQRPLVVSYEFDIFNNSVVIENLTASEAAALASRPEVREVHVVGTYELHTDRVQEFIDAGSIWDGSSSPGGTAYRGQGMVIGVIDTGLNSQFASHGFFNNDVTCGFNVGNPKVIAARDCVGSSNCTGPTPSDSQAHGSHTASTAAGNTHVAADGALAGTTVSGVAPCANLITYKACPGTSCDGAALAAARQRALIDGVDVINYSVSGGTNPWGAGDSDRDFLELVNAGTLVFASAGNTNATVTNPVAAVNHRGPWVMSVANSTHDRVLSNAINLDMGGPQDVYGLRGQMTIAADVVGTVADSAALGNVEGCNPGFASGSMSGSIALISRGTCGFAEKINNAQAAGAIGAIIYNNDPALPPFVMGATAGLMPAVMSSNAGGLAIQAHVTTNPTSQATISAVAAIAADPSAGDILNNSSLRGPVAGGIEVTKPDITGPGTNIFAAFHTNSTSYGFMTGTSMSSPHLAGAGALVKGLRPTWSAMEIKSALQLTAKKEGFKDQTPLTGAWDADDVGNGRVDLGKAALSGLVMHETYANFLAANGSQANQRALNLPSLRHTNCAPSCVFTRTVRNTLETASSWTAAGIGFDGNFSVNIAPPSFDFTGDTEETQTLTITVTANGDQTQAMVFGEVELTEATNLSPALHMAVAIRGSDVPPPPQINAVPGNISTTGVSGVAVPVQVPLSIENLGFEPLVWSEVTGPMLTGGSPTVVWNQPQSGSNGIVSSFSIPQAGGAYTAGQFSLAADTGLTEIRVFGADSTNSLPAQSSITWQIYQDVSNEPGGNPQTAPAAIWTYSSAPAGAGVSITGSGQIALNLVLANQDVDLGPGIYWLTVFPTYNNSITAPGSARWAWLQSNPVGTGSKLIAPNLFGNITSWTLTGAGGLNAGVEDVAFRLTGLQGAIECGAPWMSISPDSGNIAGGGSDAVTVSLDASSLSHGPHDANLCLASNDPVTPNLIVPVRITASGVVAANDAYEVAFNTELNVAAPGVFANDTGNSLTASLITDVTEGVLSLQSDGSFVYTPATDYCGSDSFVYEADNGLVTDQGLVSITVNCANEPPVAGTLANQSGTEGVQFSYDTSTAFSDPDDDVLGYSATGLPASLSIDPLTGEITGVPLVGDAGDYSVLVTASDGEFTVDAGFDLTITAVGDAIFASGFESK